MDTEDIGITIPTVKDLETNALSMLTPSTM